MPSKRLLYYRYILLFFEFDDWALFPKPRHNKVYQTNLHKQSLGTPGPLSLQGLSNILTAAVGVPPHLNHGECAEWTDLQSLPPLRTPHTRRRTTSPGFASKRYVQLEWINNITIN